VLEGKREVIAMEQRMTWGSSLGLAFIACVALPACGGTADPSVVACALSARPEINFPSGCATMYSGTSDVDQALSMVPGIAQRCCAAAPPDETAMGGGVVLVKKTPVPLLCGK
jgi:hypothetical protein